MKTCVLLFSQENSNQMPLYTHVCVSQVLAQTSSIFRIHFKSRIHTTGRAGRHKDHSLKPTHGLASSRNKAACSTTLEGWSHTHTDCHRPEWLNGCECSNVTHSLLLGGFMPSATGAHRKEVLPREWVHQRRAETPATRFVGDKLLLCRNYPTKEDILI